MDEIILDTNKTAESAKPEQKAEVKPAPRNKPSEEVDSAAKLEEIERRLADLDTANDPMAKKVKNLRKEAAARRIENKELRTALEQLQVKADQADLVPELQKKLDALSKQVVDKSQVEALESKLEEISAKFTVEQEKATKLEFQVAVQKVIEKYKLPPDSAAVFENVTMDRLETTAQALVKIQPVIKPTGVSIALGAVKDGTTDSLAQQLLDRYEGNTNRKRR